jgi:hypothetical protein
MDPLWYIAALVDAFKHRQRKVEVMLEVWVLIPKQHHLICLSGEDELVRCRGTKDGAEFAWEVVRKGVCKEDGDSEWMKYWKNRGMGYHC